MGCMGKGWERPQWLRVSPQAEIRSFWRWGLHDVFRIEASQLWVHLNHLTNTDLSWACLPQESCQPLRHRSDSGWQQGTWACQVQISSASARPKTYSFIERKLMIGARSSQFVTVFLLDSTWFSMFVGLLSLLEDQLRHANDLNHHVISNFARNGWQKFFLSRSLEV